MVKGATSLPTWSTLPNNTQDVFLVSYRNHSIYLKQSGRGYEKVSHPLRISQYRQELFQYTDKQPTMRAVAVLHWIEILPISETKHIFHMIKKSTAGLHDTAKIQKKL